MFTEAGVGPIGSLGLQEEQAGWAGTLRGLRLELVGKVFWGSMAETLKFFLPIGKWAVGPISSDF